MKRDRLRLFPEWLNIGSVGAAVAALQVFLITSRQKTVRDSDSLITGVYDDATAKAVRELQTRIGLIGSDVDGNFGQTTRKKLKNILGYDLDSWCRYSLTQKTIAVQPDGSTIEW
jgi:peptidoglycan hydrolase-like protein with peptidoglycan-binding domain